MKKLIKSIASVLCLTFLSTQVVADTNENKKSQLVDAKCHVALSDGGEAIALWRLSLQEFSDLPQKALSRKVTSKKTREKVSIIRVYECALEQAKFTQAGARVLDEQLLR